MILKSILIFLFYCCIGGAQGFVKLQSSGPTVLGANLTLSASLTDGYLGAQLKYVFRSVESEQSVEIFSSASVVNHTVKISRDKYDVGLYAFEVRVYGKNNKNRRRPFSLIGRDRLRVSITDLLNGKLKLIQNGFDRSYGRIFPNEQVNHVIELSKEEQQFLTDDNTYIVHWYIDCSLISSTGLSFDYAYENKYKTYTLEALVEVEHSKFSKSTSNSIPEGLAGFKCAPLNSSGYTYGYYKATVRTDATDGSPPPPRASSERPSNSGQDFGSLNSSSASSTNAVHKPGYGEKYFTLRSSGPTVRGANHTLSAVINPEYAGVERKFVFFNVDKWEIAEIISSELVVNYTTFISELDYEPGNYRFEVKVFERNAKRYNPNIFRFINNERITVPVTEMLNGKLKLIQNGFDRSYGRVFPNEEVIHVIKLSEEEERFLLDGNTYIVHWYIDCSLISSTGLTFNYYYKPGDKTYNLEAIIEVNHDPHAPDQPVTGRRPEALAGFKCAPIYTSGYTYGYYKASVRADATDGSPPPPRATSDEPSKIHATPERAVHHSGEDEGHVKLESSGPTVRGAYLTLSAKFVGGYPGVERKYVFRNVEKQEQVEIFSKESVVNYTLKLHKTKYEPGSYRFEVRVYERSEDDPDTFYFLSKDGIRVTVTDLLNGKLKMIQNGHDRSHGRIFPNERVSLLVELSQEEQKFLTDYNTYIVNWYIDCSLISSTGLHLNYTYEERYKNYVLEALVEVEHNPFSAAFQVISKAEKLKGFKCAPVRKSGFTYGYYKINVRTDATDGSPPPPSATPEIPSYIWEDSLSSDSNTGSIVNTSPTPNSVNDPWRTTERYTNTFDSGDHKNCTSNANNAVISIKDGHMKIAMDLVFHGTVNITNFQIERN